jgi:site-specific DNA recombinase
MTRAAVYARYSTDKQNERSCEDQIALCRTLCARENFEVIAVYQDAAISGASTVNRPGFLRLMRDAAGRKFDIVIAEDIDRISRDQADYHTAVRKLEFLGIEIHTIAGRVGRIEGSVRALLAQMYIDSVAGKTRRGLLGVLRDGRHAGGRSYGYRPVPGEPGKLAIVESEATVVRRIFTLYASGKSPREIARILNHEAIPGPRGGVWNTSTINGSRKRANGVLGNSLYIGRYVWNRQTFRKDPDTGCRTSRANALAAGAEAPRRTRRTTAMDAPT